MVEVDGKEIALAIFATVYVSDTWSDVILKSALPKFAEIGVWIVSLVGREPKYMSPKSKAKAARYGINFVKIN